MIGRWALLLMSLMHEVVSTRLGMMAAGDGWPAEYTAEYGVQQLDASSLVVWMSMSMRADELSVLLGNLGFARRDRLPVTILSLVDGGIVFQII